MSEAGTIANSAVTRGAAALPFRRERFWNWPNTITMLRIAVVPVLVGIPWATSKTGSTIMAWCFIVAASSDLLDGYLARRGGEVTRIGKLLDPLADKLLVSTALIMLLAAGRIEGVWGGLLVFVILGREIAVTALRGFASSGGQVMAANWQGKLKAVSQNVAVGALIFHHETLGLPAHTIGMTLLAVAAALTVWSGYGYFAEYFRSSGSESSEATPNRDAA